MTFVEDKMRRFKGKCAYFSFNKCPIYAHNGASAKFSTNSHETDNSAVKCRRLFMTRRFLGLFSTYFFLADSTVIAIWLSLIVSKLIKWDLKLSGNAFARTV